MSRRADKKIMNRVTIIAAALVLTCASLASAQSALGRPLADVARDEEARRKEVRKPARIITNNDLRADPNRSPIDKPAGSTETPVAVSAQPAAEEPASNTPDAENPKTQAYWAGRMKTAKDAVQRSQLFADSLQTRINSLTADFVNRDDPAQRAKIETDRQAALAELERVKKEVADGQKAIAAVEDEARRAGVPAGWVR
jgi:hypothetical protein